VTTPLLSFIVLSYNYEDYIQVTLRSILNQTIQDFEIVVVDDASSDRSCQLVRELNDPRINLIVNERNLGGAGAYNVAIQAARGEWLVNLDADDWIAPEKSIRQLKIADQNPQLDIIGSWVNVVGSDGRPHSDRADIEMAVNRDYALNLVDTWIGINPLCRSSTMVRRAAHLKIGLDDAGMVAAPDYELWTRALAKGCRFHVLKECLTFMRLHSRGVTRANLLRSHLEICFALQKNIVPLIEHRALWPSFAKVLRWVGAQPDLAALAPRERERLFALLMTGVTIPTYADFRAALSLPDPVLETIGRRALFTFGQSELASRQYVRSLSTEVPKSDVSELAEACDRFRAQSEFWEREARRNATSGGKCEIRGAPSPVHNSDPRQHASYSPQSVPLAGRLKRWIAPGNGRWVRTKARLSLLEQRVLRLFAS
jgi:glycosyltransferase involved in cell wall biosynthesis